MSEERIESGEFLASFVTLVFLGVSVLFAWLAGRGTDRFLEWRISPFVAHALGVFVGIVVFLGVFVFLAGMADFLRKTFTADRP